MTVEDAYKILRATASSTWESIEQSRRQLVQKAHPDNVVGLSADKRTAIQSEAKRVNVAYNVLRQVKIE
jgi:DnaJ-class molecular chaperone